MARMTKALQIEAENEAQALQLLQAGLATLPDPRRAQGLRYPLQTVVTIALMASVCGCDDAESMQAWGEAHEEWRCGFLPMPHGAPTRDVFLAVFGALDPEAFNTVFRAWAELLTVRLKATGKQIAIDAMGCQTAIAKTIRDGEGHYLLAVKDNQPTLHEDIQATFAEADDDRRRTVDEQPRPAVEVFEHTDKGHGRVETRTVSLCRNLTWLTTAERWGGLSFVARIVRERFVEATGKTSKETAYYIGSDRAATAATAADKIRRHWSIENQLHWVLDFAFREDEARHRAKNTAANMTTLRHFALNLIKSDKKRKLGIANARKRAGWDRSYLVSLLTGA